MMQILADYGLWFLGAVGAVAGWGFRFVLGTINGKIKALQSNCINRANAVEQMVERNKQRHDNEIAALRQETREQLGVLDRDVKNVGESVRTALGLLRSDLFQELSSSRKELNESVGRVNQRLDILLSPQSRPPQ